MRWERHNDVTVLDGVRRAQTAAQRVEHVRLCVTQLQQANRREERRRVVAPERRVDAVGRYQQLVVAQHDEERVVGDAHHQRLAERRADQAVLARERADVAAAVQVIVAVLLRLVRQRASVAAGAAVCVRHAVERARAAVPRNIQVPTVQWFERR